MTRWRALIAITLLVVGLTSCGQLWGTPPPDPPVPTREQAAIQEAFDLDDWRSVREAAEGQTVNWYMWGGSEPINQFVQRFYGTALARRYAIRLNQVPVDDTIEVVEQLLREKEAGIDPGSVDLIWINGENFATLKHADMLYGGWTRSMPNSHYVDWDNPALNRDFGEPIEELESPWSSAQFQFIYDTARMDEDELPRSYREMKDWACDNPGRFTYIAPGPGAFQGTRFVKGALYEISGGAAQWSKPNETQWERWSPELWDFFNELEPCLWREGRSYPRTEDELHALFKAGDVDFSITQVIAGTGPLVVAGVVPDTARPFVFDEYMIGDYNYVAIPANAPHKAAAIVLANLLLEPQFQAVQILPEHGFGLGYGIDVDLVPEPEANVLRQSIRRLGDYALHPDVLSRALAADTAPIYQDMVEEEWRMHVPGDEP